jgi:hypothetical protein
MKIEVEKYPISEEIMVTTEKLGNSDVLMIRQESDLVCLTRSEAHSLYEMLDRWLYKNVDSD